jgi:exoribonuclease R
MKVIIENWLKNKFYIDGGELTAVATDLKTLKWMPGDSITADGHVVERSVKQMIGIVDILNRTRFGTTPRGVPLYIMYPLDVSYPPCLVALKVKPETNMLIAANYEHWDGIWPRAGFVKTLGPVGDLKSELDAMLPLPLSPCVQSESELCPNIGTHSVLDWDVVLHIDPPGCKDVDDVFCWKWRGPTQVTFSIGIADVASWVPEGSELDKGAYMRGSTLYDDGVAIAPMFPTWLSEGRASLRSDGVARPAVCLTFDLEKVDDVWRVSMNRIRTKAFMTVSNVRVKYAHLLAPSGEHSLAWIHMNGWNAP